MRPASTSSPAWKQILVTFPANVASCFRGWMIAWHVLAIVLTIVLVLSGFDWWYFKTLDTPGIRRWLFPAAGIGFVVPIYVPLVLLLSGFILRRHRTTLAGGAIAQAEIIGLLISSTCKAFTGRAHPSPNGVVDISREFHFGFLQHGMFWGWPSSHTTIAFAMAFTVYHLFPKQRWPGMLAVVYAAYIGIGISGTIHWFSDFVAGAILGAVIGTVVGRSFVPVLEHLWKCSEVRIE
jgi:hypothetical protein